MADITNLSQFLGDVADAIRTKRESTEPIAASEFDAEILKIETGTDTSDATATADDIIAPKTAYTKDGLITGSIQPTYIPVDATKYEKISLDYTVTMNNHLTIKLNDRVFYVYRNGTTISVVVIKDGIIEATTSYTLTTLYNDTNINDILLTYDSYDVDRYVICVGKGYNNGNGASFIHFRRVVYSSENKTFELLSGIATTSWGDTGNNYGYKAIGSSAYPNSVCLQYSNWTSNLSMIYAELKWTDTSGSVTTLATSSRTSNYSYGVLETGDGHQFACAARFYVLNNIRNSWSYVTTSGAVYISHNCQYMVYNNALYLVSRNENASTMFNSKLLIQSGLPSYSEVRFSKGDAYMILRNGSTLYVYSFDETGYVLIQTLSIGSVAIPFDDTYFLEVISNNLQKYEYTSGQVLKSLTMKDYTYTTLEASEVPDSSNVLQGVKYMGLEGPMLGAMPNNKTLNYTPSETQQTIPLGYTSGGKVAPIDITSVTHYKRCLELSNQIIDRNNVSDLIYKYELNKLSHLWDGIQNSASGHSSSAAPWYDFKQSAKNMTIGDAAATWDADSLNAYSAYSYLTSDSFSVNECTIEVTGRWKVGQSNGAPVSFGSSNSAIFGLRGLTASSVTLVNNSTSKTVSVAMVNTLCTITLVRKADGVYFYKDGVLIDSLSGSNSTISGSLLLSGISTHTYCRLYMDINCIRMYDKALTEEQIQNNYLVDKDRFNF